MKLKVFDRILLALLLIVAIVCAFVLFGVAAHLIPAQMALDFVTLLYADTRNALILAACGLVLLLICLKLVFCGRGAKEPEQAAAAMIRQGEFGGTYIALTAIDTMVQKHCRQQSKVRDVASSVKPVENGVAIGLKLSVLPDTDVVNLTAELQKSLKEHIESLTGVNVTEVGVLVENADAQPAVAGRVE